MKKFTLLFTLLLIGVLVNGQPYRTSALKIQEMQKKYSLILKHTDYLKRHQMNGSYQDAILKSTAATITLDSVLYLDYDMETAAWVNVTKDEYIYSAQLQNSEWLEKGWNDTLNTWEDNSRIVLEYDNEGMISEMMIWSSGETGGELVEDSRLVTFYNNEGVLDSILHYYAETEGNWEVVVRQYYYYNDEGQLTRMDLISLEEDEVEDYLQVLRFEYTYDDAGKLQKSSMYFIDEDFEVLFSENEYFYDAQGKRTASEQSMLDFMTFETSLISRTEYNYNATNDVSEEIIFIKDETTDEWVPDQKSEYEYRDINFADVIFPSYANLFGINEETNEFNKALDEINSFIMQDGNWVATDKTVFFYSDETATSAPENRLAQLMVYPNPASDHIFVKWDGFRQLSMEVYQVTGAKAMELFVHPGQGISISHLQKGIYIYKLLNNSQIIHSGKLIKN